MLNDFTKKYVFVFSKLINFTDKNENTIQGVQLFLYDPEGSSDRDNTTLGLLSKFWFAGVEGMKQWPSIQAFKFGDHVNVGFQLVGTKPQVSTIIDTGSGNEEDQ